MATRINIDKIEYESSFQKFYDESFFRLAEELFKARHFTIEEYLSSFGYRGFIVRNDEGFLSAVSTTIKLNNDYISFMLSDDEEGADVDSVLSLCYLFEDSNCKRYYNLDIELFTQEYLVTNSLVLDHEVETIYDKDGDSDKNLYIATFELTSEDPKQMALFL